MTSQRGPRGLLDTSTVILLNRFSPQQELPQQPMISTITLAELTIGPLLATSSAERAARQAHLQEAEATFEALPFDRAAARAFGAVAADLRSRGPKPTARSFDALIAAVAVANGLALWTVNARDFAGIGRLDLIAVDHPDR